MINKNLVITKLEQIKTYLKEIEPDLKLSPKNIKDDYRKLRTLERDFQLIVDTMVSINTHLISKLGLPVPDDYQSTFSILGENKIIPMDFALKIAPAVGMRNRIVHRYGDIDKKKFIIDIQKGASDFKQYCRYIEKII